RAYPWTWDAVGGGSTWWYLPMWWMLGTYLAWLGGMVWAQRQARGEGEVSIGRLALPVVGGAVALTAVAMLAQLGVVLPLAAGGLGRLCGFATLWVWVRLMRRLPHLLSHLMAPRAAEQDVVLPAGD